ncbi:uncharacterized protein HMPREF1541_09102 [Cyphellophora europaea CBS 101466]|uniref:Uncharacterized protein n=1 Tax=Cyphellophora europaea (strain CBS 101466) TaxID=1220924 RepID=W2S964_CYPE1|nr:uncharacterized protein HMPREF1541_09102 [Cyphellophora europaea CBS 101466]ETN45271.1 hypothetical protein HMPREF1541_09102 [Cyphellophora europaea CBS 101466]
MACLDPHSPSHLRKSVESERSIFHFSQTDTGTIGTTQQPPPPLQSPETPTFHVDIHEDAENVEKYSFTPKQLPRGPRAWERQPAQPFTKRNEAQKVIWKRAPLKNITTEANKRWKRGANDEDGEFEGNVRPAKRVKMGTAAVGEKDKENVEVEMAEGYVPVVWGARDQEGSEDGDKHRDEHGDQFSRQEKEGVQQDSDSMEADDSVQEDADKTPEQIQTSLQPIEDIHEISEQSEVNAQSADGRAELPQQPDTSIQPEDYASEPHTPSPCKMNERSSEETVEQHLSGQQTSSLPSEAGCTSGPQMCFDIVPTTTFSDEHITANASKISYSNGQIIAELDTSKDVANQIGKLLRDEPQPESEVAVSPPHDVLPTLAKHGVTDVEKVEDAAAVAAAPQFSKTSVQPDEDDTAYLQQFLQRAKEAREKNPSLLLYRPVGDRIKRHLIDQHNQSAGASPESNDRKRPHSPEPDDISELDSPEEPTVTTTVIIPSVDEVTEKPPSPSRRSNRLNANTKLPRPQRPITLPSNISLRRLNGTEFISMAKQRSEVQNAAMLTRNNTRKNKGAALPVQQRLDQIKLGFADTGEDGASDSQDPERKKKTKRRKNGQEFDRISWAHKIARYQQDGEEHTLTLDGSWETNAMAEPSKAEHDEGGSESDIVAPELSTSKSDPEPENEHEAFNKSTSRSVSTPKKSKSSSSSSSTDKSKSSSKSKPSSDASDPTDSVSTSSEKQKSTKRKRVEKTGTVNGTPAPKRGLDLLLEEAKENVGVVTALGETRERERSGDAKSEKNAEARSSKRLRAKRSSTAR